MKVVLISPIRNVTASNFRGLGAALARGGHDVFQIFLPDIARDRTGKARGGELPYETPYPASLVADVAAVCDGAGLVGMTLMTNHFERMADLTARLRPSVAAPIVWGGIHATVKPRECLQFADAVALGEADETVVELARRVEEGGDEWRRTPGFWVRCNGDLIKNDIVAPPSDLGALPLPLFQPGKDLIQDREEGRLVPLADELLAVYTDLIAPAANAGIAGPLHMTAASRGCAHACSFCSNAFLKKLDRGYVGTRWRPAAHVLAELKAAAARRPRPAFVFFSDDEFLAMPPAFFQEFVERYPHEVGLPFRCFTSADTITREKLEKLVPLGFFLAEVGVQSAARRTRTAYRRQWLSEDKLFATATLMREFAPRFMPTYDILVDNPYEDEADRLATLDFITRLPRPYFLQAFSLTFYPGTDLYERAKREGRIVDEVSQVYRKNSLLVERRDYIYTLTTLNNRAWPRWFIRLVAWRPWVWLMQRPPLRWVFAAVLAAAKRWWGRRNRGERL